MLQAEYTLGIIGGVSAAIRGGDIQQGVLFGVIAGATTGLALGAMGPAAEGAHVWAAMAKAGVSGTGAFASSAYAGGKGSIQEVIFWAAMGNISSAVLSGIGAALVSANPAEQAVTEIDKDFKDILRPVGARENMKTIKKVEEALNISKANSVLYKKVLDTYTDVQISVFDAVDKRVKSTASYYSNEVYKYVPINATKVGRYSTGVDIHHGYGLSPSRKIHWKDIYMWWDDWRKR